MSITIGLTWIFIFVAVVLLITFLKDSKSKIKKVIFFGDSITQMGIEPEGYITLMQSMMLNEDINNYDLMGAGISGNKIYDLFLRVESDVISQSPDIVVMWIGVNDVWQTEDMFSEPDTSGFENIYKMVVTELLSKKIKLMLVTPALIGEKRDGINPLDKNLSIYCEVINSIADKFKLPVCDMHALFHLYENRYNKNNLSKGILTVDGVHLNDMGNRFAAQEILKVLKAL